MSEQLAFERGCRFLLGEAAAGFPEAVHRMRFPAAAGFSGSAELQAGDVFSRAILGGLLPDLADVAGRNGRAVGGADCEADGRGVVSDVGSDVASEVDIDITTDAAELRELAAQQAEHVAARKLQDCAGGWSYFPGLPELPPDLDTLGAVISLFARVAPQHLALCRRPIEIALAQRAADGRIPTFLISAEDDDPARVQAMTRGTTQHWGNSADADVLARFYSALLLLDAARYAPLAPLAWLAKQQQPEGCWRIPWYAGRHYGTRLCADLFQAIAPQAPAALAASAFLRRPDPEASALDIAVSHLPTQALIEHQQPDGSWPACPWITMPIGRPGGQVVRTLQWQSRTITTAYCLRRLASDSKLAAPKASARSRPSEC